MFRFGGERRVGYDIVLLTTKGKEGVSIQNPYKFSENSFAVHQNKIRIVFIVEFIHS